MEIMQKLRNAHSFLFFFMIVITPNFIISQSYSDAETIKNGVWSDYETNHGAYYYAYSPYSTAYSKVTSYIYLPPSLNTNGGNRNAFISFGILGYNGFIDMGIMNSGEGWKPVYCDNGSLQSFPEYAGISNVKIVGIEIEVLSTRKVVFSLSFRDSQLNILKSFSVVISAKHIIEYENGKPKFRFYRFASLVNLDTIPDDQNDQTYMINGIFTGLVIVVNGVGRSWGISSDYIEIAWKVSPQRIEFSHANDHESFSIKHYRQ